ncbi:MAG: DNA replication and repair protein RecF [Thermoleophilia bacterium]|nr:DNA replication and repair protein RecF [Thermoleophilia bacterium]
MYNVRSRRTLGVELGAGLTIFVGANGAGKTTILEAVTLVLQGNTLRSTAIRDLITRGQEHLRVEVDLEAGGVISTAAAAYSRDGDRRLTADGAVLQDSSRWREALPVRTFVPDDLRLIKGSPKRRREYLDTLAARCDPEYSVVLNRYEEALAQRNTLLRMARSPYDTSEFTPWESILAQTGLQVCRSRSATLSTFIEPFQKAHHELTGDPADTLHLAYRTNVADLDEMEYRERLAEMRGPDRQRTYTHLGPHRDDLKLLRNGLDVRECASQGEQRAALLTLILAEWRYQCENAQSPLLLLDDVMSELDEARRRALVHFVSQNGQVIITTTDLRYFTAEELRNTAVVELAAGEPAAEE